MNISVYVHRFPGGKRATFGTSFGNVRDCLCRGMRRGHSVSEVLTVMAVPPNNFRFLFFAAVIFATVPKDNSSGHIGRCTLSWQSVVMRSPCGVVRAKKRGLMTLPLRIFIFYWLGILPALYMHGDSVLARSSVMRQLIWVHRNSCMPVLHV